MSWGHNILKGREKSTVYFLLAFILLHWFQQLLGFTVFMSWGHNMLEYRWLIFLLVLYIHVYFTIPPVYTHSFAYFVSFRTHFTLRQVHQEFRRAWFSFHSFKGDMCTCTKCKSKGRESYCHIHPFSQQRWLLGWRKDQESKSRYLMRKIRPELVPRYTDLGRSAETNESALRSRERRTEFVARAPHVCSA